MLPAYLFIPGLCCCGNLGQWGNAFCSCRSFGSCHSGNRGGDTDDAPRSSNTIKPPPPLLVVLFLG